MGRKGTFYSHQLGSRGVFLFIGHCTVAVSSCSELQHKIINVKEHTEHVDLVWLTLRSRQ